MNILFVDDEQLYMSTLIEELVIQGHVVTIASDVDSALAAIEDPALILDLAIMDVMMPPGTTFGGNETADGMRTGIALYKRLRAVRSSLPVIMFTNVSDPRLEKYFGDVNDKLCRFLHKPDVLPFEFADLIVDFADEAKSDR